MVFLDSFFEEAIRHEILGVLAKLGVDKELSGEVLFSYK